MALYAAATASTSTQGLSKRALQPSLVRSSSRRLRAPRAQQDGGNQAGSSGTDWDAAWARYQQARASGARATTRTVTPSSVRPDPAARLVQDTIRREESILLNLWSSQWFQGGMALVAVGVLAAFVAAAGPPPVDDRCTLPWC